MRYPAYEFRVYGFGVQAVRVLDLSSSCFRSAAMELVRWTAASPDTPETTNPVAVTPTRIAPYPVHVIAWQNEALEKEMEAQ